MYNILKLYDIIIISSSNNVLYLLQMYRCIGQQSVSADKSNLFHYRLSADCSKSADDQDR